MSNIINIHSDSGRIRALAPSEESGFTLIEILVAIVILSIGLLGVASMQVQGLRNNQSAYLRTQATLLAYDMADRMRTNSQEAIDGTYDNFNSSGVVPPDPQCITNVAGCSSLNLALTDLHEWADRINGTDESTILLPSAQGRIIRGNDTAFTIEISWQEKQWDDDTQLDQVSTQTFSVNLVL